MSQGSSYLSPRGYAILHRLHHAYSDTPKDPHSPTNYGNVFSMMWATKQRYQGFVHQTETPEAKFDGGYPEWTLVDTIGDAWFTRVGFVRPLHALLRPLRDDTVDVPAPPGALPDGPDPRRDRELVRPQVRLPQLRERDVSRNTLVFDFLTVGELFQNNHHTYGMSPKFAARWFEVDPTYVVMKGLDALGIIDMTGAQKIRWTPADAIPKAKKPAPVATPAPVALDPAE